MVSKADIAVPTMLDIKVPNDGDWYLAPDFHHAREQGRLLWLKPFVEAHGKSGGPVFVVDFQACRMRFRQPNFELMEADSLQVDPKEVQQLNKIEPVDDAYAEELLNTRHRPCGFYLAEPRI